MRTLDDLLIETRGNISKCARILGVKRGNLSHSIHTKRKNVIIDNQIYWETKRRLKTRERSFPKLKNYDIGDIEFRDGKLVVKLGEHTTLERLLELCHNNKTKCSKILEVDWNTVDDIWSRRVPTVIFNNRLYVLDTTTSGGYQSPLSKFVHSIDVSYKTQVMLKIAEEASAEQLKIIENAEYK